MKRNCIDVLLRWLNPSPPEPEKLKPWPDFERKPYRLRSWSYTNDSIEVKVRANGYCFNILITHDSFLKSPVAEAEFSAVMESRNNRDDSPKSSMRMQRFMDRVADLYASQYRELAGPPVICKHQVTLDVLDVRGFYRCDYRVEHEVPIIEDFELSFDEEKPDPELDLRSVQSTFPVIRPSEVNVCLTEPTGLDWLEPQIVFFRGQKMHYKSCYSPWNALSEVQKREPLTAHDDILASKLFGVVVDEHGQGKALLSQWIWADENEPMLFAKSWELHQGSLAHAVENGAAMELREKWAKQLRDTVARLHELGTVWEDVCPGNVRIDKGNNAIITGLGTSYREEWVDPETVGTAEGDLKALDKLEKFVLTGEEPEEVKRNFM